MAHAQKGQVRTARVQKRRKQTHRGFQPLTETLSIGNLTSVSALKYRAWDLHKSEACCSTRTMYTKMARQPQGSSVHLGELADVAAWLLGVGGGMASVVLFQ